MFSAIINYKNKIEMTKAEESLNILPVVSVNEAKCSRKFGECGHSFCNTTHCIDYLKSNEVYVCEHEPEQNDKYQIVCTKCDKILYR